VSSIEGRLRRLEGQGARCPECGLTPDGPGRIAMLNEEYPYKSFDGDPDERCARCGRSMYDVIMVVYGEEGGGSSY
jgi:DNA-directed RNA polymerase subunit RPC12/RpoP